MVAVTDDLGKSDPTGRTAAVLIDMDGTLIDSTAVVEAAWARFADKHGLVLEQILAQAHGRPTGATVRHFLGEGPLADRETARIEAEEEGITDGVVEIPGAADFVRSLRVPWALVTSAGRRLATVRMAAAGVPLPEVMVTSDDIAHGKPDPEPYLMGAQRLGVDIADCLVLEDSAAGIESGTASGARTVVVGALADHDGRLPRVPDLRGVTLETLAAGLA